MKRRATLPMIVTAARAGNIALAQTLFDRGGFDRRTDDPAACAVRGRLLKDQALGLPGVEREAAFAAAAGAYAAADRIVPQPYTRINVATLTLLSGDPAGAAVIARGLLDWLDHDPGILETPYYLSATRAEALLLCGEIDACEAMLRHAIAVSPQAWEDQASTIRQFERILAVQGRSAAWLDSLRPPRSLHFSGHLGVDPERHEHLSSDLAELFERERIGFAFGALAAGAEIVIAEQALAAGARLHVLLPGTAEQFAAFSVDPFGAGWRRRFDRCLAAASEVRSFPQPGEGYQPLASHLAAEMAMGAALVNAHQLASDAVQVLVCDEGAGPYGSGLATGHVGEVWAKAGGRQHVLREPRIAAITASGEKTHGEGASDLCLAAMLHIAIDELDDQDEAGFAQVLEERLRPFHRQAAAFSGQPDLVLPFGNARVAVFADPARAWRFAEALLRLAAGNLPLRLAGHYGLSHRLDDPPAIVGRAVADLERMAAGAMPGVLTASEPLACVLQLALGTKLCVEPIGEAADIPLFAVTEPADLQ